MKILAIVLAVVFVILAILTASGATAIFPAIGLDGTHHTKHAVLYAVLAILCLIWYRMAGSSSAR